MNKINVLIVDDSAVVRQVVSNIIAEQPDMAVLGAAQDPIFAMERMRKQWPDVILLDVEMPRMDGITFLRKLMAERPTPVVICSTLTEKGAQTTIEAMSAGAVAIITKAKIGLKDFLQDASSSLVDTLRAAARANLRNVRRGAPAGTLGGAGHGGHGHTSGAPQPMTVRATADVDAILPPRPEGAMTCTTDRVVALGTSTGGTQALEVVLPALPVEAPGMVIVQHMPEHFTAALAQRLNGLCQIEVREARNNDRVGPGRALIAPGGKHMILRRSGAQYFVEVREGPLVNRHRPCVDVLFRSVATTAGRNAMGILLTGMGADGAAGLLEMHQAGAFTVAQDEETSIVFGMPKEAIRRNAADKVVPLQDVASSIMRYAR